MTSSVIELNIVRICIVAFLSPMWCNGQYARHWTQGSRVQSRPRRWVSKDDKNTQHTFFGGVKSQGSLVVIFYGM
jgi:hypothetical protein